MTTTTLDSGLIPEEPKKRSGQRNIFHMFLRSLHSTVKNVNQLFFGMIFLFTHPIRGLEKIIQLLKNRAFALVLFAGCGALVYFSTVEYLPALLHEVFPSMTAEAIRNRAIQIALGSEIMLGMAKIKKARVMVWMFLPLVLILAMSGFLIDFSKNYEHLSMMQRIGQIFFALCLNCIPVLGIYMFGNDAAKVPAKKRKRSGFAGLNAEDRSKGQAELITLATDYYTSGQNDKLTFTNLATELSKYKFKSSTVSAYLKKNLPEVFLHIKTNSPKGRKLAQEAKPSLLNRLTSLFVKDAKVS
ncbi:MAG: hypothetical protein SFU98_21670 [Leptospiraceae bacterium]|nr:hypothetical protein [Leptospiraceae bacterium]